MTLEHSDPWLDIHLGDVREVLPTLPADSVDCIVTSPPYWGLRDYGTAAWNGGDAECDHTTPRSRGEDIRPGDKQGTSAGSRPNTQHTCGKCGAIRQDSQLGLERTPEEYVANLVAVFRELRRVLKPSGTCWLNLGDSYASGEIGRHDGYNPTRENGTTTRKPFGERRQGKPQTGLKPKDLVGIPWRVAFALQADGWYLRSDIIWAKPNPMPESVTDRPTKAHEYLFLLTKSARYYFDADAVREAGTGRETFFPATPQLKALTEQGSRNDGDSVNLTPATSRKLRSVWTIATRPYPGAHFAVFPPELPERCIKAGSSERGVCPECGAPWERVVERTAPEPAAMRPKDPREHLGHSAKSTINQSNWHDERTRGTTFATAGWRPICRCEKDGGGWVPEPAVILDPFAGSGTVGMVANRLSRRAILVDLNGDYLKQQLKRNAQTPLGLT